MESPMEEELKEIFITDIEMRFQTFKLNYGTYNMKKKRNDEENRERKKKTEKLLEELIIAVKNEYNELNQILTNISKISNSK